MPQDKKLKKSIFSKLSHFIPEVAGILIFLILGCMLTSYFLDTIEYAFTSECAEGESRTLYCYKNVEAIVVYAQTETRAKRRVYLDTKLRFDDGQTRFESFRYRKDQNMPQLNDRVNVEIWRNKIMNVEKNGRVFVTGDGRSLNFSKMDGATRLISYVVFAGVILLGFTFFLFRRRIAKLFSRLKTEKN